MTNYGKKIAELRTANKMTQAQLGEMLNVTSQAVSKWENGLSEPDIESIKKICEIFQISFNEFFGAEPKQDTKETTQQAPQEAPAVVLAYCDTCDKPLYNPKEYRVTIENGVQHTTCLDCIVKKVETKRKQRDELFAIERQARREVEKEELIKGLLWGIVGGIGLALLMLFITMVSEESATVVVVSTVLGAYGGYAMLTQFIWVNSVWSVFGFFKRTLKLPGVIFTLNIEGLLFLIFVKIFGAILSAIVSVLLFIIGFIVTWVYAMIIFPFALIKEIRDIKKMY